MNKIRKVVIMKPEVKSNESEDDYVSRCIPWVIENEDVTASQAAGKCHGMFRSKMEKRYSLNIDELEVIKKKDDKESFDISVNKMESYSYIVDEDFKIDNVQIKKGQELHYILGVVLEPESVDATRTEETIGDIYSEDEVRKAAHYFLANYGGKGHDFMHNGKANDSLKIVESFLAPIDMKIGDTDIKKGTWLMGTLILDNEIWNKVKKGEITGYSIGGRSGAKVEIT